MRKFLIIFSILLLNINSSIAFEDCVLFSDGKLTNFIIEPEKIVNINPIYTIQNEKNMFILEPIKIGKSKLKFTKDNDKTIVLDLEITENKTIVNKIDGIEVYALDSIENSNSSEILMLDLPPVWHDCANIIDEEEGTYFNEVNNNG